MSPTVDTLVIHRPDDWHLHLRDGAVLESVLGHTAAQFDRAIVMLLLLFIDLKLKIINFLLFL